MIIIIFIIGSFARNFHIGFDPDYEFNNNMRPVSNKTHDDRIVKLVIAIELQVKNEQFRLVLCHRTAWL